jgi:8-oxo-dGTP pyrophosphatase MutT (NUDIX family)
MQQPHDIIRQGAGIIPFTRDGGRLRFLLHTTFKGRRKGLLVDFGGGSHADESAAATAAREFIEETEGMYFGDKRGYRQMKRGEFARQQRLMLDRIGSSLEQHPGWRCERLTRPGKEPRIWQTFFVEIDYRPVEDINRAWADDERQRFRKRRELIWLPAPQLLDCYRAHPERLWTRLREYQGVEEIVADIERNGPGSEKLTPVS